MIGRYTMGARERKPRLGERGRGARGKLPARDDFEDLEFLAVLDDFGDRDRRARAHDHDAVGAHALGTQDLLDRGARARKRDACRRLVEPAADRDFGRNPSVARVRANA